MSALFNFQSLLLVLLLLICTSAYVHHFTPGIMDRNKNGYGMRRFDFGCDDADTIGKIHGYLLEMREDRRKIESFHKYMLCPHGWQQVSILLN
ncbi:hypothetical protein ACHAPA_003100 [Fusarium lateritium]